MSRNVERAERALDEGLDLAAAPAYGEHGLPVFLGVCWRCEAADPETDVGLCAECLAALRDDETTAAEPVDVSPLVDVILSLGPEARRAYEEALASVPAAERAARARVREMFLMGVSQARIESMLQREWALFDWLYEVSDELLREILARGADFPVTGAERRALRSTEVRMDRVYGRVVALREQIEAL